MAQRTWEQADRELETTFRDWIGKTPEQFIQEHEGREDELFNTLPEQLKEITDFHIDGRTDLALSIQAKYTLPAELLEQLPAGTTKEQAITIWNLIYTNED